jgi:NCAIR mutase (PurE)-related protein
MSPDDIRALLERVRLGEVSIAEALGRLAVLPFEDLGYARVDHHRALRTGFPEVVFGPGKTPEEIAGIVRSITDTGQTALVTRVDEAKARDVLALLGSRVGVPVDAVRYEALPRFLVAGPPIAPRGRGKIAVVSAGTSDRPVAEEAARTAELFGNEVVRVADVGVAGLHRIISQRAVLDAAEVVIVVAGMEGALPSVVAGLISRPVIAVPTSVGIGASFGGMSALLGMLNSCAPGVTVVNIDAGFSAGYAASLMNLRREAS